MKKDIGFEEAMERLDTLVRNLESGAESLDSSLSLFEEGVALIKLCNEKLDKAEQKVRILTEADDGSITDMPFSGLNDEN